MEYMSEGNDDESLERLVEPEDIEHPPRPDYWDAWYCKEFLRSTLMEQE